MKIAFIGAGNMAEAIVRGLLERGGMNAQQLTVADPEPARRLYFQQEFGISAATDNREAAGSANVVILAVKPQQMAGVLAELRALPAERLWISIAAGISSATIEQGLGGARVVRVMPNTPALVGRGVSALCRGSRASPQDLASASALFAPVGAVLEVDEFQMDAVTAVSGSGPAYVFYLMEAMLAQSAAMGISPETARELVYGTIAGAAALASTSTDTPAQLRARVTSKGGTTASAIAVLDGAGVQDAIRHAIAAARDRSAELSRT